MAEPDDIKFKLTTEGDTSGAEAVEKSIFAAVDAEKQAQMEADVAAAQAKQAVRIQQEQAAALREVADAAHKIVAAKLAQSVGEIGKQFAGISPEVDMAVAGTQNFLNVLATTGDPVKASLALIGTAIGGVITAYREAAEQSKELAKKEEENIKHIAELRANFYRQVREEHLVDFFQKENERLDEQEAVLIRIAKIRASERGLAAAEKATANAAAVTGEKETAQAAAASNLTQQVSDQVADIRDKLQLATAAQQKAQSDASLLAMEAQQLQENSPKQIQVLAQANAKQKEADKLLLDLDAQRVVTENQIKTILAKSKESANEIGDAAVKAQTEVVKNERAAIQAEVDRLGAAAPSNYRAVLSILDDILKDGAVRADEMGRFAEAQGRLNGIIETANKNLMAAFNAGNRAISANDNELKQVTQMLIKLAADSDARFRELSSRIK